MTEGQIVVDVDKNSYPDAVVELELSGMSLANTKDSPVYVASVGDEVIIDVKSGTENTVSDGTDYINADNDTGAIYSKDDIKFKGKGSLTVNGNAGDAIAGKDDIKIYNGNLTVNAADDGIRGKDSVIIGNDEAADCSGLSVSVKSRAGDGIKAVSAEMSTTAKRYGLVAVNGGKVNIESYADGIQAEQYFEMNGGDLTVKTHSGHTYIGTVTGGGYFDGNPNKTDISVKGIKAVGIYDAAGTEWQCAGDISINGGNITIDSSDDCLHCSGDMNIFGGVMKLASADDAVHSDHTLTVGKSGGGYDDIVVCVESAYEGIEANKIYQNSGSVIVNTIDDGYNAAGGTDSILQINGGFALVNVSNGDHDGFDSNGNVEINGGYAVSNGNEAFDCGEGDSVLKCSGGVWVSNCPSVRFGMGGAEFSAVVENSCWTDAGERLSLVDADGTVILSFIIDKKVKLFRAGGAGVSKGAYFMTGGTLNGSAYFQHIDATQPAAYGGTLTGGTKVIDK